jgi:hypothetical protein
MLNRSLLLVLAVALIFSKASAEAKSLGAASKGEKRSKATPMEILKVEIPQLFRQFEQGNDGRALKKAIDLLSVAEPDPKAPKVEILAFLALKLRLLFTAFNYIDAKLIPNFDLETQPALTVAPPLASGLPAGVAPESIKDPKIRAEYENELAANRARTAQYYLQSDLRRAEQECTDIFKAEISLHSQRYSNVALGALIEETVRSGRRAASLKALAATSVGQPR